MNDMKGGVNMRMVSEVLGIKLNRVWAKGDIKKK